ncbi:30708_t:CDS:2, partial [Gigaspora margarita]
GRVNFKMDGLIILTMNGLVILTVDVMQSQDFGSVGYHLTATSTVGVYKDS